MDNPKSPPVGGLPPNLPIDPNRSSSPAVNPNPVPVPSPRSFDSPPSTTPKSTLAPHPIVNSGNLPGGVLPRSSIRTMESDIKSAQTGQSPKGTEVKPPAFSTEITKPQPSSTSLRPPIMPPTPPVGVKLGEAEKRTAFLPGPEKILLSKPEQKTPETKVGLPLPLPSPILPKKPPLPPVRNLPASGGISVPTKTSIFGNKKVLALLGLLVLVLLGGIWFWRSRPSPEIAISSPTPASSAVVSPSLNSGGELNSTLTKIFQTFYNLSVAEDRPNFLADFQFEAINLSNAHNTEKNLLVLIKDKNNRNYNFSGFLNRFSISFPANLTSAVEDKDFALILTKQTEFFDGSGKLVAGPSAEMLLKPKMALAVRVTDAAQAKTQLTFWEDTMLERLGEFYGLPLPAGDLSFSDNTHRSISIRYVNFPTPDRSIDYAIVTAKNGNDYLIIANSREQMFLIIDKLLGF